MRLSVPLVLGVLLLTLFGAKGNAIIQPDCVTPVNGLGKCVPSRFCISIMTALINNDHLTNPTVARFLRQAQCGIQQGSHKVCCDINDIDFGNESESSLSNPQYEQQSTPEALTNPYLPPTSFLDKRVSDYERCGRLGDNETPLRWIGELWFEDEGPVRRHIEVKCLGTVISHKHLVVPAHCVASLPENVTLDFVENRGKRYSASKIFIHASYNKPKFANDIAIIELDTTSDEEINDAVCLPESQSAEHDLNFTIVVVKRAGGSLQFGKALFNTNTVCSSYFNQQLTDLTPGQFCANVQSNETAYSPFIGAIAIESSGKQQYTFKGFTSTAIRSGQAFDESKPYIFTDIAHYTNWIYSAIGDELRSRKANADEPTLDLQPCQLSSSAGSCVRPHQCSLYRDPSKPLSELRESYLDRNKCFTTVELRGNSIREDGVCCENKYIELDYREQFDIDQRFIGKRGVETLNMTKCGQVDPTRRIVGGAKADLKEFPWVGLVKYKVGRIFKFTCGSSLISNKYALTAAHCISSLPPGYEIVAVRLGEYDLKTDPDCKLVDENQQECNPPIQDIPVEHLIPHPKYNTPRYANDVGLIRLSKTPDMTQGIVPICLPINSEMQKTISDKYTVAGFGFTENGYDSDVLLKVVLPKVSKDTCQSIHRSMIQLSEGQECYGGEGIQDSCKGDSGNPLINYVNLNGRIKAVQWGIVVAGHSQCGRGAQGFPGIYSDINYYMEWIIDNLEE